MLLENILMIKVFFSEGAWRGETGGECSATGRGSARGTEAVAFGGGQTRPRQRFTQRHRYQWRWDYTQK